MGPDSDGIFDPEPKLPDEFLLNFGGKGWYAIHVKSVAFISLHCLKVAPVENFLSLAQ
jgi:hypothetical protein